MADWRARYAARWPGRRRFIGVVWAANPDNASGATRSVPVEALAPLSALPDTGLIALQGGAVPVQLSMSSILGSALALVLAGVIGSLVAFRRIAGIEPVIALGVES